MTGKKLRILLLFLLLFPAAFIFTKEKSNLKQEIPSAQPAHKVKFFEQNYFEEGIKKAKEQKGFDYHVRGGVLPHDLFISFIIADFFKRLSFQNPQTIILIGPNHYEKGDFKVLTSLYNWETPFGIVNPDYQLITKVIGKQLAQTDEENLPNDHAVSGLIPFIKYYLPGAKVAPFLLSGHLTKNESEALAKALSDLTDKNSVIVASLDFSHYLTAKKAEQKDEITLGAIKNFNYGQIFLFNNDHLDSPPSLAVLLMMMQSFGTVNLDVLNHLNSGSLQKNNFVPVTSFFSFAYY